MNRLKWVLPIVLAAGAWLPPSLNAEIVKCLVLVPDFNAPVYFPLVDEPSIFFKAEMENPGELDSRCVMEIVSAQKSISVSTFQQNKLEIKDLDISGSSLEGITDDKDIELSGHDIIVNVHSGNAAYQIVDINGVTFREGVLTQGVHTIKLSELESGIYIVKVNNNTLKIRVK